MSDAVEVARLTDLINDEIIKAMGMSERNPIGLRLRPMLSRATRRFSKIFADVDEVVAQQGLMGGARALLPYLTKGIEIHGAEKIPSTGPLVVASNHPGTVDSVAITAGVPRPDLKIIASAVPFLRHLPNISRSMIFTPPRDPHARLCVVRESLRHLEKGGCLLVFGRGRIDPDPAFMPNPEETLGFWSRSLEIFLERVPRAKVLVTIVSGVLQPRYMRHPVTWLRGAREDRQRLAMMLQVIAQMLGRKVELTPSVTFGEVISQESAGGAECVLPAVIDSARRVLAAHVARQHAGAS